jgi:hypothetical protein
MWRSCWVVAIVVVIVAPTLGRRHALGCDFCTGSSATISDEISGADVAVIATMIRAPEKAKDAKSGPSKAVFQIDYVLKGGQHPSRAEDGTLLPVELHYFGNAQVKTPFLLLGVGSPKLNWGSPFVLSTRAVEYVRKLSQSPGEGPERLEFFQSCLEDTDAVVARDAFDEFAKAPYGGYRKLKQKLDRGRLLKWIADKSLPDMRKRLYLMLLSVCGTAQDVPMLRE